MQTPTQGYGKHKKPENMIHFRRNTVILQKQPNVKEIYEMLENEFGLMLRKLRYERIQIDTD